MAKTGKIKKKPQKSETEIAFQEMQTEPWKPPGVREPVTVQVFPKLREEKMPGTKSVMEQGRDIPGYFDRLRQKRINRQLALADNPEEKLRWESRRANRDILLRGKPLEWKNLEGEDLKKIEANPDLLKKYNKEKYRYERNTRLRNWLGKKAGAGYGEAFKGEAPAGGKAGWFGKRLIGAHKYNPMQAAGRKAAARGALTATGTNIKRMGTATREIGEAFGAAGAQSFQPIQIFTLAWKRMSTTLKWLVILVFLVVILFVPWGVFYYTGWAVGAAFMFLISLIYWAFASFFNAIAYVLVTAINAVASIIMGIIIWIVEFFMGIFMKPNYFNPSSKKYEFWWGAGHSLFDNSLLKYSDVATIPTLMVPITPKWQSWMNQILIVKLFELVPGLQPIATAFTVVGEAMGKAFQDIIIHSPPWMVIVIGLLPVILVVAILIVVYKKYRAEVGSYFGG